MFNLNKSLAKLKESIETANLAKLKQLEAGAETNNGNGKDISKKKTKRPKKAASKNAVSGGTKQKRGVILIKNFPHGFYEKQMFDYFSQFGEVTRLKIARSRKTGNPRSYGFVEFQFEDVAKIATETMNNYIMFDHIVKCSLLPSEKVPKNLFLNWNRPFISSVKTHKVAHNQDKSSGKEYDLLRKRLKRIHNMEKALSEKGIEFKCVIVNRPSGLHKATKEVSSATRDSISSTKTNTSKQLQEVVLNSPKSILRKKSTPGLHRKLVLPKFMVVNAGFNYKC